MEARRRPDTGSRRGVSCVRRSRSRVTHSFVTEIEADAEAEAEETVKDAGNGVKEE